MRQKIQRYEALLWLGAALTLGFTTACAADKNDDRKWVASWATPIAMRYGTPLIFPGEPRAKSKSDEYEKEKIRKAALADPALPNNEAFDQTFRMIIKPDLWGDTVRVRFSNVFGSQDVVLTAAALGLQDYGGHILAGTGLRVTFGGRSGVTLPKGRIVLSDPVHLPFVTSTSKSWLRGRNLAISFAITVMLFLVATYAALFLVVLFGSICASLQVLAGPCGREPLWRESIAK